MTKYWWLMAINQCNLSQQNDGFSHFKLNRGTSQANDLFFLQLLFSKPHFINDTDSTLSLCSFHNPYHCCFALFQTFLVISWRLILVSYSANHEILKTQRSPRMTREILIIPTSETNLSEEPYFTSRAGKTSRKSIAPNLSSTNTPIGETILFSLYFPSLAHEISVNNLWEICNHQTKQTHIQVPTKNPTFNA